MVSICLDVLEAACILYFNVLLSVGFVSMFLGSLSFLGLGSGYDYAGSFTCLNTR